MKKLYIAFCTENILEEATDLLCEREREEFVINQIYYTSFKNVKNKRLSPVLNNVPYVHAGMQGLFIATSKIRTFYPSNPILMAAHILYNNIC